MSKLRRALTKRVWVQLGSRKKPKQIELEPSNRLVYGMYFAFIALICLTILEATYILVLRNFSNEIFAAISLIIGTILGTFFGQKA